MILALALGGCAVAPDRVQLDAAVLGDGYSRESKGDIQPGGKWWEGFGDDRLNMLVEDALAQNLDLAQIRARLEQAKAVARASGADRLPDLTAGFDRTLPRGGATGADMFSLSAAASYEVDLWGGNRAAYAAGRLGAEAAAEDLRIAAITLASSVVEAWLNLRATRAEIALLKAQIDINEQVLDLQKKRYANGIAGALDVLQQQELLAQSQAQLPDLRLSEEQLKNRIAFLTGRSATDKPVIAGADVPVPVALPDSGMPVELLGRRPDIRAAWLRLAGADWSAENARIERLPNLTLSMSGAFSAEKMRNLFDAWVSSLAADIALPVIDGGARRAEHDRRKAVAEEALHAYSETVLNAVREVEDALAADTHQQDRLAAVERQLDAARYSLQQAQLAYSSGDQTYLSVLNGMLSVQSLERTLIRERRDVGLARVGLYRALGGRGWTDTLFAANDAGAT